MIELDYKLFELCKPEGIFCIDPVVLPVREPAGRLGHGKPEPWYQDRYNIFWSPSTNWADLAPLIEKETNDREIDFVATRIVEKGWPDKWEALFNSMDAHSRAQYGPTLPEAAARALVALLENQHAE